MQIFPNFFYSINLSVDKVYNAKNIFWIATLYRKIGRKITFDFDNFEVNFIPKGGLGFQFDTCF